MLKDKVAAGVAKRLVPLFFPILYALLGAFGSWMAVSYPAVHAAFCTGAL